MLEDSVAKHMRADVTVGAFLSGGIDSTAIAALAKRHNPRADHLHHRLRARGLLGGRRRGRVGGGDRRAARDQDGGPGRVRSRRCPESSGISTNPVADPALVPLYFIAREARKHVKVVLSGEGADELFGGYTIYREPLSLAPFDYLPRAFAQGDRQGLSSVARGYARQEPAAPRLAHPRGALLRQRPQFLRRAAARGIAGIPPGRGPTPTSPPRSTPQSDGLGPGGAHAAHRPVHLAARRHPGQGRQDDHGQLAGAAGAVPGSRGVRGGFAAAAGAEDH